MRWIAILYVFASSACFAQNQYRCEGPDHKRTHQGTPCAAGQKCSKWDGTEFSEIACQREKRGNDPCRNDAVCWGTKVRPEAGLPCERAIEATAKHQAEWTNGWLDPTLTPIKWVDENEGVIRYGGNQIKMQNGFGAWTRMHYYCDWNSTTRSVDWVFVSED